MSTRKRDDARAKEAEAKLIANDGYCPCKVEKIAKNKCPCRDWKMNVIQHEFYGTCNCGLFEKVRDDDEKPVLDDSGKII